ncbi:hypothetical protein MYX84_03190 [Acidobacteria bacterium AH-259-O06]|nr:hypothetical protein [Acidobacteria bacterium AH-259-O06]
MKSNLLQRYFLPGLVFQSVVIGGGYGTGRELVEFFLTDTPLGGLLGIGIAMLVWSLVAAASFEFARITRSYDYKSFFSHLLGRGWIAFELAYFLLLTVALSVLGAASGSVVQENFGIDKDIGTISMMLIIGILVFYGSSVIENVLAGWSFVLYGTYAIFVFLCFSSFGDQITTNLSAAGLGSGWFKAGVTYAGYNVAAIPAILFCTRHIVNRKEALTAGLLAGPIAMVPGALFFFAVIGHYPEIVQQTVPINYILTGIGAPYFHYFFQIVLFGTFIETGTAMIHAINERIAEVYKEKGKHMPKPLRPAIAIGILVTAIFAASTIGLVDLIAKGYGLLTYVFIAVFVVPVLTLGMWKICRLKR